MYPSDSTYISFPFSKSINDLSCNNITIQQVQDVGSAYIVSIPSGAKIYIDNIEQVGLTTPATVNNIPSITEHIYKLTKSGYIDVEGILFITTGQTYNVTVTLCKSSSNILPILTGLAFAGIFLVMTRKEIPKLEIPKLIEEAPKLKERPQLF